MKRWTVPLAALLGLPSFLIAASLEDLNVAKQDEMDWSIMVKSSDSLAINLSYVGGSSEAYVTINNEHIRAFAPFNVADTTFGEANSSYSFVNAGASASTGTKSVGDMCAVINGLDNYNCSLLGAKYNDSPLYLRNQAAAIDVDNLRADGGFDVKFDTAGTDQGLSVTFWERLGKTPASGKRIILKECKARIAGGSYVSQISVFGKTREYEGKSAPVRDTRTLAWGPLDMSSGVFSSSAAIFSVSGIGGLQFAKDVSVVIEGISKGAVAGSSTTQTVDDLLWCTGVER